eukprot:353015-Chlamydomonas_euryale.AAC.6
MLGVDGRMVCSEWGAGWIDGWCGERGGAGLTQFLWDGWYVERGVKRACHITEHQQTSTHPHNNRRLHLPHCPSFPAEEGCAATRTPKEAAGSAAGTALSALGVAAAAPREAAWKPWQRRRAALLGHARHGASVGSCPEVRALRAAHVRTPRRSEWWLEEPGCGAGGWEAAGKLLGKHLLGRAPDGRLEIRCAAQVGGKLPGSYTCLRRDMDHLGAYSTERRRRFC